MYTNKKDTPDIKKLNDVQCTCTTTMEDQIVLGKKRLDKYQKHERNWSKGTCHAFE